MAKAAGVPRKRPKTSARITLKRAVRKCVCAMAGIGSCIPDRSSFTSKRGCHSGRAASFGLEPFQIDAAHTEPGAVIDALVGFGLAIGMALGTIARIQSE